MLNREIVEDHEGLFLQWNRHRELANQEQANAAIQRDMDALMLGMAQRDAQLQAVIHEQAQVIRAHLDAFDQELNQNIRDFIQQRLEQGWLELRFGPHVGPMIAAARSFKNQYLRLM